MTTLKLSEKDIRKWIETESCERGYRYFENGTILDAQRQGMTLKAYCDGSRPLPYRVSVTFDRDGISDAHCSCPAGGGGRCKHVAALLFTYLNHPGDFREVEELDTALGKRTKEELIGLIKQMLSHQPELEVLVETPLPTEGKRHTLIDIESYRRRAAAAFRCVRHEWGVEIGIATEMNSIVELGKGFAEREDYASAAIVYQAVSQEVLSHYEMFDDEEGELGSVVNDCVEELGRCLAGVENDTTVREMIMHALFDIYRFDVDFGGVGLGDEVPDIILKYASPEERRTVAVRVRAAMPPEKKDSWSNNWHREEYGGFLLDLEKEALDDEGFLRICRETGRLVDLVERLLALGRCDEAITDAEKAGDYDLLQLADIFVAHGQGQIAEHLLVERTKTTRDSRILDWLKKRYKEQGNTSAALALAQKLFQMHAELSNYQEVRCLAQKVGDWEKLRIHLLSDIASRKEYNLLTKIYLDEGEIDQALETVKRNQVCAWAPNLQIEVARAAEKTRPHSAIELYLQFAEALINVRGRDNYRQACIYLSRARNLYQRIDQEGTWTRYILALRERNRSLRALIEELSKAGI